MLRRGDKRKEYQGKTNFSFMNKLVWLCIIRGYKRFNTHDNKSQKPEQY